MNDFLIFFVELQSTMPEVYDDYAVSMDALEQTIQGLVRTFHFCRAEATSALWWCAQLYSTL